VPQRADFKELAGGISVIFFDFDGTLTKTPGDRAVRSTKLSELKERAPMLSERLGSLKQAGATLGIISKSTEATVRDCLDAAGLTALFEGPIIGKAVNFEGKVGIIAGLAKKGALGNCNMNHFGWESDLRHTLLVDDDVMELERCRQRGVPAFAADELGGLQEADFDIISAAISKQGAAVAGGLSTTLSTSHMTSRSGLPYKWRTLILFTGDCFEGR
jgi:phosphoglycolate phosphatase-like HAD superfamily hydrolase